MGPVKRVGAKVWIEDVPPEEPVGGIWHFDGCPAALRAMLKYKGIGRKYLDDTVFAAILGQPFRFWFSADWASCLAYTHEVPLGVLAAQALGLDCHWYPGGRGLDDDSAAAAWRELKIEIDAGNPVLLFGGAPDGDPKAGPVVVTGYDEGQGLVYFVPHSDWQPAPRWSDADPECKAGIKAQGYRARKRPDGTTWIGSGFAPGQGMGGANTCFFAFRERLRTPSEQEIAAAVMRHAVAFGRGKLRDAFRPHRKPGLEAFDLLAKCLDQDGDEFVSQDHRMPWAKVGETDWWYSMEGIGWPEYRKTAAAFFGRCAADFGGFVDPQKSHLLSASKCYEESAKQLEAFRRLFESVGPLESTEDHERTLGKALVSREFRKKAADVVRGIRKAEENALLALEKALVPAAASRLSAEQKKRLLQWRNIFGNDVARCTEAADANPMYYDLLELELKLDPLSVPAKGIRDAMTALEPADMTYWARIVAIVGGIGRPETCVDGKLNVPAPGWVERQQYAQRVIEALRRWQSGADLTQAQLGEPEQAVAVSEAYKALGAPDADKKRLVALALVTLTRATPAGWNEQKDGIEALRQDKRWGGFAHRIEMLDPPLWSFEHNVRLLLHDIGKGFPSGQWHVPGGPLSWSDGNPMDLPRVADGLAALESWLWDKPSKHELIPLLGKADAYKEKRWLVCCLVAYLREHKANYYSWQARR